MFCRPAQPGDFDAIAAITNHYIRETTIHWAYEPVSAQELRTDWEVKRESFPFLVALERGSDAAPLLGYAKAGVWRDRAAYAKTAEVGIYLRPDLRGRGLGRQLYAALIDECRRREFRVLVAGIALPNAASIRLHESLGFVYIGTFRG